MSDANEKHMSKYARKGAPLRRWIVGWLAEGQSRWMAFPNLARARGYAKELADTVSRLITGGHDEDGGLAALVESIRIYAAVLEPVDFTAQISQPHREARRMARNHEGNRREGVATP